MQQSNQDVRQDVYRAGLRLWQVAAEIGISDTRFSVWLRTPLSDERRQRVLDAIAKLTK